MQKFNVYIRKILKQVHPDMSIAEDTVQQLNSTLNYIGDAIVKEADRLVKSEKKKTLGSREIQNAVRSILPDELSRHAVADATRSITRFLSQDLSAPKGKGKSKGSQSGLVFEPARAEHLIREYTNFRVGTNASVYFAGVLDYLCAEMLELSGNCARDHKRVTINLRCLFVAIEGDEELSKLFRVLGIKLSGGGVLPGINSKLLPKKGQRQYEKIPGGRRALPGTGALKDIRKLQKTSQCLMFAKLPFERFTREVAQDYELGLRFEADAFTVLQYHMEQRMIDLFRNANEIAIIADRSTIKPRDVRLARNIRDGK